jgi:nitrogen fixation protein NifU and related proteins
MNLEELLKVYRRAEKLQGERAHDKEYTGKNLSCGDEVTIYVKLDGDRIEDISFKAAGCAISTSFTYMLSEKLKGKRVQEVLDMTDEEFIGLIGMKGISPGRIKCALIPLVTIKRALRQ